MGLTESFLQKFGLIGAVLFTDPAGVPFGVTNSNNAIATCPEEHHTAVTEEYTADGAGAISATLITPTSGKKIGIHVFQIQTDGASGDVSLDFATSSQKVGKLYASKTNSVEVSQDHTEGAVDEVLTLTATGIGSGAKVFVKVQYVEED